MACPSFRGEWNQYSVASTVLYGPQWGYYDYNYEEYPNYMLWIIPTFVPELTSGEERTHTHAHTHTHTHSLGVHYKKKLKVHFSEAILHQPSVILLDDLDHTTPQVSDPQEQIGEEGNASIKKTQGEGH